MIHVYASCSVWELVVSSSWSFNVDKKKGGRLLALGEIIVQIIVKLSELGLMNLGENLILSPFIREWEIMGFIPEKSSLKS